MSLFRQMASNIAKHAIKLQNTVVKLYAPDGTVYDTDTEGNPLVCEFLSGRTTITPDTGEEGVVFRPVATFHRTLLPVIPQSGEKWAIEAPLDPDLPDIKTILTVDNSKAIEGGRSLGVIRLYLSEVKQP